MFSSGCAMVLVGAAGEPVGARARDEAICTAPWPPTSAPPTAVVTVTASTASCRGVTIAKSPSVDLLKFSLLLTPSSADRDERVGQPVEVRVAVDAGRVDAGQERHRVERVARRHRHLVDLIDVERRGDRRASAC